MDKSDEFEPDEEPARTKLRLRTSALASMSKTTSFLFPTEEEFQVF